MKILLLQIIILIVGIAVGFAFTTKVLAPKFLLPRCFLETNSCVSIQYQRVDNTALIQVYPENYFLWYNGRYLFVYGEPTTRECPDLATEPVYMADLRSKTVKGYGCISPLEEVRKIYAKSPTEYVFYRPQAGEVPDAFSCNGDPFREGDPGVAFLRYLRNYRTIFMIFSLWLFNLWFHQSVSFSFSAMEPQHLLIGGVVILVAAVLWWRSQNKKKNGLKEGYLLFNQNDALIKVLPGYQLGVPYDEQSPQSLYPSLPSGALLSPDAIGSVRNPEYKPSYIDLYKRTFGRDPPDYENGKPLHRAGLTLSEVPQALDDNDGLDEIISI